LRVRRQLVGGVQNLILEQLLPVALQQQSVKSFQRAKVEALEQLQSRAPIQVS
jgi:hypothetical protein